jgi:bacterioferritin-associated ferredoxin
MGAVLNTPPVLEAGPRTPTPRAMTRCACTGVAFVEIVRQVQVEGRPLGEVLGLTGCARTCGACLPDLHARLDAAP